MKLSILILNFFLLISFHSYAALQLIDRPGQYDYGFDLEANPTTTGDAIIQVTASDVKIDLRGHQLFQASSNQMSGLTGICISENLQNVRILNGKIENITGVGIKVSDGCQNITIEDMLISDCDAGGIFLDGNSTGTGIEKISITNCFINSSTGAAGGTACGLRMNQTKNFEIVKNNFLNNDAGLANSGFGCIIENSQVGNITGCTMQNNGGNEQGIGCFLLSSTSIILKNCSSIQNICRSNITNSFAAGFATRFCENIIFHCCDSLQNRSIAQESFGFNLEQGSNTILKKSCIEGNNGDRDVAGIRLFSEVNSMIKNCVSNVNQSISGIAYGIFLEGSANHRCYIAENEVVGNVGISSRGIVDQRSASTSFFQKNNAFNNGTNYVVAYPLTITLPLITGSLSLAVPGLPGLLAGELDNVDVNP